MTDFVIAHRMQSDGMNVSSEMVKQRRRELLLPANKTPTASREQQSYVNFRPDPLAVAQQWIEGFDRVAMTHHGKPIKLDQIMMLTNSRLKAEGIDQLGPESWRA
jgi:hypothetical protein